jgi:superfamily II DNA or RNA helicase
VTTAAGLPRLHHGDLVRIRGERWRVSRYVAFDTVAIIDVTGCGPTNRATHARFLLPFDAFDRLTLSSKPRLVSRARWRHVARRTLANALPSWSSLQAARDANLSIIPFQLEPAIAMTKGDGCRFLIADAVGLGKTVEAGLMIAETLRRQPDAKAIVIAPAGLRDQWRDELRHRFNLEAPILDASRVASTAARVGADINPWAVEQLVITSIDYVKRPEIMRSLEGLIWDVVVLDEAHHLTGKSDRAAAAAMLSDRARVLVLLTATPHSGNDAEFSRLCSLGNAGGSEPLVTFRRTRADAGVQFVRRAPLIRVRTTSAEAVMHEGLMDYARRVWRQSAEPSAAGARLAVSVLMRRACSSAGSLARSIERRLALLGDVPPTDALQPSLPFTASGGDEEPDSVLGSPGLHDLADERRQLARLLQISRTAAADESKVAMLRRFVSRVEEPAIVFTEYRDTLQRLAVAFSHVDAVQLHGGLSQPERAAALRRFTEGNARLLLATDTGSEGLNLQQRCRLVINLELPWTPLRLEQRAGRIDRIGQQRRPHAVHLVAAGTCEEATLAALVFRLRRIQDALGMLAQVPDEERVAESVLGAHPRFDLLGGPPPHVPAVVPLDARAVAQEEALRIRLARSWVRGRGSSSDIERPVIAHLRRRRERAVPQCLWVYSVVLTTSSGRVVWEALLPLRGDIPNVRRHSTKLTRNLLDSCPELLQRAVEGGRDRLVSGLQQSMQPALLRWNARECDLAAALRARHARLSAGLIQRGLFDRRDERLVAAQTSLLREALSRSADRLRDLVQSKDLRVDTSALVFAVVLE